MLRRIMAVCCLFATLLCSCSALGGKPDETVMPDAPSSFTCTFGDSLGASVTLGERPQRVAVLFSSFAEVWTLAGGEVSVTVGESIERGFAPEGTPLVDDGAGKTIDVELLLSYQPDLVIGSADIEGQVDAVETVRSVGVPAALFRVENFEDYVLMLGIFTEMTGHRELYGQYGTDVGDRIAELKASVSTLTNDDLIHPEILFIRAGSSANSVKAKSSDQHFAAEMLTELGAHNIANDAPVLLDGLSIEEIILRDPDCIFISSMGDETASKAYMDELFASEGWRDLSAVRDGHCYFLPKELFHYKPNARWAEAYEYLAALLYPGDFDA